MGATEMDIVGLAAASRRGVAVALAAGVDSGTSGSTVATGAAVATTMVPRGVGDATGTEKLERFTLEVRSAAQGSGS